MKSLENDGYNFEQQYLCKPVKLPDCTGCNELDASRAYRCLKYRVRLFYYRDREKIKPCTECINENFDKEENL